MCLLEIRLSDYGISPWFSSIFRRVFGNNLTIFLCGFLFTLHILVFDIHVSFGLNHIYCRFCFHDKVRFILVCTIPPIYFELIRDRTNPFKNIVVVLQQECKDANSVESTVGKSSTISFEDINVYAVDNGSVKDIKDYDLRLISQTDLDAASDTIASDFSKLLES